MRRAEDAPPALKRPLEESFGFAVVVAARFGILAESLCQPLFYIQSNTVRGSQRPGTGE